MGALFDFAQYILHFDLIVLNLIISLNFKDIVQLEIFIVIFTDKLCSAITLNFKLFP